MKNFFNTIIIISVLAVVVSCSKDNLSQGIRKIKSIGYGVGTPKLRLGTKGVTIYQGVNTIDAYTFYTTSNYIREQKGLVAGGKFEVPVDDENYGMVFLAFGDNTNGFTQNLNAANSPLVTKDNTNKTISFTANSGDNICFADFDKNNMGATDVNIVLYPFFSQLKIDVSEMFGGVTINEVTVLEGVQNSANVSIKFGGSVNPIGYNVFTGNGTNKFSMQYPYTNNETISLISAGNNLITTEQNLIPNGKTFKFRLGLSRGTTVATNDILLYEATDTNKENPLQLQSGTRYIIKIIDVNSEGDFITEIYIEGHDFIGEETLN